MYATVYCNEQPGNLRHEKGFEMNDTTTILLVDDDEVFLQRQQEALEHAGYLVVTASGRNEAEQIGATRTFDCAVVDLMMEEADGGFVLAHHLRKVHAELPIVLVTDVTGETGLHFGAVSEIEKKWIKADTVLAKPIRFEQLHREIKRLLAARPQ